MHAHERKGPPSLVLVVASAGSTEGLDAILDALTPSLSVPVVLAFAGGDPADALANVVAKTSLDVVPLEDAPVPLQPGRVIIVSGVHGFVCSSRAVLPSAQHDMAEALRSAAQAFDGYLTVVVLAGAAAEEEALNDVRDSGGLVVREDALAPRSGVSTLNTELRAPRERSPRSSSASSPTRSGISDSAAWSTSSSPTVFENSGIDFRDYKSPTIVRRLSRVMTAGGFDSFGQYLRYLRGHPDAYGRLIRSLLINVTDFFRDPPLFEYLREEIVPELIAHADANAKELRFWSAGCATGEEAYSLAIMLAEVLGDRLCEYHIRIFGTDLDEEAIAFARRGVYPASALDGVPEDVATRYFTKHDGGYEVKKEIRNLTVFGEHDLGQRAPFPRIDLCLCRNVLIYFAKELQQRTLQLFAFSLRDGGYLVLGKAETTSPLPEYFRPVHRVFKVYQRHGRRVLIPPSRIRETTAGTRERPPLPLLREGLGDLRGAASIPAIVAAAGRGERNRGEASSPRERLAAFVEDSSIGVVIVDRRYDIQAINQAARTLLNVHGIGVGEDLIHAVSGIAAGELRAAIDAAFDSDRTQASAASSRSSTR